MRMRYGLQARVLTALLVALVITLTVVGLVLQRQEAMREDMLVRARDAMHGLVYGRLRTHGEAQVERLGLGDRVAFEGSVGDDRLVALYRDALAVSYAPFDEDYGYVTLEAFLAGRPVITAADSGGTLQFVLDGEKRTHIGQADHVKEPFNKVITDGNPREITLRFREVGKK